MKYTEKEKIWSLQYPEDDAAANDIIQKMSDDMKISLICAKVIYNRGYKSVADARKFIGADINALEDPFLMRDMDVAVSRILEAVQNRQKITVYGDYDVDGVTSVTLIYLYLKDMGADVDYYIPSRSGEGYGLSVSAIDKLKESGTELIVTVDTGITAVYESEYAKAEGIDMVITDHHECHQNIPEACAVVNPHRPDCKYPFAELAGVGVVFKLICAAEMTANPGTDRKIILGRLCDRFIDLVALGTIADVMPLRGENRAIVKMGLEHIAKSDRCGLAALLDAMSNGNKNSKPALKVNVASRKRKVNAGLIGYGVSPRINAAGRISSASKAVELLLCDDYASAYLKAEELCEINLRRQIEENNIANEAYEIIEKTHDFENDRVIVVSGDNWHQGIIGIVASRVTEKYGLPSILISFDGSVSESASPYDTGKGSGRSVKGLNLVEALGYCSDMLERYGGHELAAGLTLKRCNVDLFRRKINEYAEKNFRDFQNADRREADCELKLSEATMHLAGEINLLEPFGVSNANPVFMIKSLSILKTVSMGGGKHLKLILTDGKIIIHAVYFNMSLPDFGFFAGDRVDLLCQLNINEFREVCTLQLIVQDIRLSEEFLAEARKNEEIYRSIVQGKEFDGSMNFIPERDDIIDVYRQLRRSYQSGHGTFSVRMLLSLIGAWSDRKIDYVKLKLTLDILNDIKVCGIVWLNENVFDIEINENPKKTSIEESKTYRMLVESRHGAMH